MKIRTQSISCPLCAQNNTTQIPIVTQERKRKRLRTSLMCRECGLHYLDDYTDDRSTIYDAFYGAWGLSKKEDEKHIADAKRTAFKEQLTNLLPHITPDQTRLLDIGTGKGYLLDVAESLGFDAQGIEPSPSAVAEAQHRHGKKISCSTLHDAHYKDHSFDIITLTDVLEHISQPMHLMKEISRILSPNGILLIITPNITSRTHTLLGKHWFQYKHEHVTYWGPGSIARLLTENNFAPILLKRNIKRFNLSYYYHYFRKYSLIGIGNVFVIMYHLIPKSLRTTSFSNPITGEMLVIARKK